MSRRIITKSEIDKLLDAGEERLVVSGRATVTDLAREHALERGFTIVLEPSGSDSVAGPRRGGDEQKVRAEVRSAVLAQLGESPKGLDAALNKVLGRLQAETDGRSH